MYLPFSHEHMRLLHILFLLVGVQLMINGVFFSSSLLTAVGAALLCLFILLAVKRGARTNGHSELWPTYHQIGENGRHETYFAPLALIALIGGALAYLFLPLENVYERTAVTLAGTGLLYLLLATFAHGFRLTMKNILGVLFSGLLLLGVGASVAMRWTPLKDGAADLWQKVSIMSGENNNSETNTMTGEMLSGDILTWTDMPMADTGLVDTETNIPLNGSGDIALTYGQLVPYIAQKYNLNADGQPDPTFTYIPQNDERYKAFKAAYYNRFFGRTVNPDKEVSCDNYIVFIGLAEQWPVSYNASNVYEVFRAEAERRWILYGCKRGNYVKRANLY